VAVRKPHHVPSTWPSVTRTSPAPAESSTPWPPDLYTVARHLHVPILKTRTSPPGPWPATWQNSIASRAHAAKRNAPCRDIPFLSKIRSQTVCIAERRAEICGTTPTVSLIVTLRDASSAHKRGHPPVPGKGLVGGILAWQGRSFASGGAPRRVVGFRLHPGDQPVHAWRDYPTGR